MQIEHDPKESRQFKPSLVSVLTTALVLGVGGVASRGGFADMSWPMSAFVTVCGLAAGLAYFSAIHIALKGWDRLWLRIKRKFSGSA